MIREQIYELFKKNSAEYDLLDGNFKPKLMSIGGFQNAVEQALAEHNAQRDAELVEKLERLKDGLILPSCSEETQSYFNGIAKAIDIIKEASHE